MFNYPLLETFLLAAIEPDPNDFAVAYPVAVEDVPQDHGKNQ